MKTIPKKFSNIVAILLIVGISCSTDHLEPKKDSTITTEKEKFEESFFYEPSSQKNFSLRNQVQLNTLAALLAKESGTIKILKDAAIVDLTDRQGTYKAISVKYQVGGHYQNDCSYNRTYPKRDGFKNK